jgi:hypothetical protein
MFVRWEMVTGAAASTTPGRNPTPTPMRAASPGGNQPPATGPAPGGRRSGGTVTRDGDGWVTYLRLEDPPGLSPITAVGRYTTVEEAQVATDEVWAAK